MLTHWSLDASQGRSMQAARAEQILTKMTVMDFWGHNGQGPGKAREQA
jgi:hypothetical protein